MSEVIEDYIRKNPAGSEAEGFDGFLRMERISSWVGNDEGRKERLRREFTRVWAAMHPVVVAKLGPGALDAPQQRDSRAPPSPEPFGRESATRDRAASRPNAPQMSRPDTGKVGHRPTPSEAQDLARHLNLLCATCSRLDVWRVGGDIVCRNCGRKYDDLLDLVPVTPVGPFAYAFGEGLTGWLTAGGIAAGLAALYILLRSLRWG